MGDSVPFSVLNERLRPRFTAMERLCTSLNTLEERQTASLRSRSETPRPTVLPTKPERQPQILFTTTATEPEEEPEENVVDVGQEEEEEEDDFPCLTQEGDGDDLLTLIDRCLTPAVSVEEDTDSLDGHQGLAVVQENDGSSLDGDDGSSPVPTGTGAEHSQATAESPAKEDHGSPSWRNYEDGTLPDLIRSGRPLSRRRTLGPISDTLKEVRREVELSRRRSLRLKSQVDKLQEGRDGQGWSKQRDRVTEEVLSILRLLLPLTDSESSVPETTGQDSALEVALNRLQVVARKLAINHTEQDVRSGGGRGGHGREDSAILQQALWDRDEAIEKKKAMEAELLRSKTELMMMNNQLLEAVQKRLELSLELEAWKDDVQRFLQQQLQTQQQAEAEAEAQKKSSRLGLLRRNNNRPPIQRPASFPLPPAPPSATNQVFINNKAASASVSKAALSPAVNAAAPAPAPAPAAPQRNWRDRLRRGKTGRQSDQDVAVGQPAAWSREDDFHNVSLD